MLGPVLTMRIDGMRASVMHHLSEYHDELSKQIRLQVEAYFKSGEAERQIRTEVTRSIDHAVREATKHAVSSLVYGYGPFQKAVHAAVADALKAPE